MRILEYLIIHGKQCVGDIAQGVDMEPLKATQTLKKLKDDEFVDYEREGRFVFYSINKGVHFTALQCIHKRYDYLEDKSQF